MHTITTYIDICVLLSEFVLRRVSGTVVQLKSYYSVATQYLSALTLGIIIFFTLLVIDCCTDLSVLLYNTYTAEFPYHKRV